MTLAPGTPTEFASTQYIRLPDCPHCGAMLLPADSSEFLGRGRVRNTWSCEDCGKEFSLDVNVTRRRVTSRRID